ncbi:MAG TPA: DUF5703 domain-containing protein [Arachidicoccus sp.]|nr:DUF5703 domain-containing protein [Arachidicoccus sp.]
MKKRYITLLLGGILFCVTPLSAQQRSTGQFSAANNNIVWQGPSKDASGSMPCGGGDIGLNVWVEKGDILFYMAKSDAFDENNALLKLGRVRIRIRPNPFEDVDFTQTLQLQDGSIYIKGQHKKQEIKVHLWVDVFHPVIHCSITSGDKINRRPKQPFTAVITYESWRKEDHIVKGKENNENSYKFGPQGIIKVLKDHIQFSAAPEGGSMVNFFHHNQYPTVFDATVHQQGLDTVKNELYNPLENRITGGYLYSKQLTAAGTVTGKYQQTSFTGWQLKTKGAVPSLVFQIGLYSAQTEKFSDWQNALYKNTQRSEKQIIKDWAATRSWWSDFWKRSFIQVDPDQKLDSLTPWKMGRNYQLFRYMLACNAFGNFPTKFNGGLFTYDPDLVNKTYPFTPDFRNWGGGTFTAQNQRLVYFPMLKSGDYDMMRPAFEFYRRLLKTAELRSAIYWHHGGAAFTEQLENFGLPNPSEYGWKRPSGYDPGMQYNAWLEYEWDTVLEFCDMILQSKRYNNSSISAYLPLIKSCINFFAEHYRFLAKKRSARTLDGNGHLILYPGSAAETYKLTYNASSTIAALKTVTTHLLALPADVLEDKDRQHFASILKTIPPIPLTNFKGRPLIAPAVTWSRINNTETPQLYPVFPWGIYGVGKPDLAIALNTWNLDTTAIKNRSYVGWKQDNIFAARLGLTKEATALTMDKFRDGPRRFPVFWGPGFDWVPDHNHGGSAMIGLQEMLLQINGKKILLFPAWPKDWDVHFKLHCPENTTVEARLQAGKLTELKVIPAARAADVINYLTVTHKGL